MKSSITVTKIEVARRQLRTAIELWFADGDPISIHTLAAASHQVIHDLNKRKNGPDLLLDTRFINDKYRKEFVADIKYAANFMKHAEKDGAAAALEFMPESNNNFISFSIFGLRYLGEKIDAEEIAFERWHTFRNPDLMTAAGKALFVQTFTTAQVELLRSIQKHKFLEAFRFTVRQSDPQQR